MVVANDKDADPGADRGHGDLPIAAMARPTQWGQYDVDVRFRLHRIAAHLNEHTVERSASSAPA